MVTQVFRNKLLTFYNEAIYHVFMYFSLKWEHGLSATVNEYVDKTINMIVPFLQENGLDPMELPEIIEGFEVVSQSLYVLKYLKRAYVPMGNLFTVTTLDIRMFSFSLGVRGSNPRNTLLPGSTLTMW